MRSILCFVFVLTAHWTWAQKSLHDLWTSQLQNYVSDSGEVDYARWKKNTALLESYIQGLEENPPQAYWSKNDSLAYFINAYNAVTVQLILDNYPLKSIRRLITPWRFKRFTLNNKKVSLGHIEHQILRKMKEPRIHFAINCASASCPRLRNRAFLPQGMNKQLEAATREFINDPTKNIITKKKMSLSKIFFWFGSDFGSRQERRAFINRYTDIVVTRDTRIDFLPYDWALNE